MMVLLGSIFGFLSSTVPDLFKMWQDKRNKEHEIVLLQMQMENARQAHSDRLEEINAGADIEETKALYQTYTVGVGWVDALNGTVRPVIAYSYFALYAAIKLIVLYYLMSKGMGVVQVIPASPELPWLNGVATVTINPALWDDEDKTIFAAIISFYFGARAMSRMRKGH